MENEVIGKVKLDYSHYLGEDFYCDGIVEDELLEIVKNYSEVEYGAIIEERKKWEILYHLSPQRENIVSWLPINKDMKLLEIGSGCGAITGALAKKAGSVDCVDLSRKRSLINAYRHENCEGITINVGNFQDIEPDLDTDYDCALLIGVFEYAQSYIGGKTPFEDFLKIIRKHVRPEGTIVIAIENRYGLKYWAGCREDHLATFFSSIEAYSAGGGVRTFSRKGLEGIFERSGEKNSHFYYPYPDYKFMTTLFSDKRLPDKGELYNNARNFDRDRMLLFDEKTAFDGILDEEMFPFFSNSYMAVLGNEPATEYIRYSNDRALEYQISTEIVDGKVKKHALYNEGKNHIKNMEKYYHKLSARYEGSGLTICPCKVVGDVAEFPFVKGRPLSELLDEYLASEDYEGFEALFKEFVEKVSFGEDSGVADLDLVFSNILIDGDKWTVIDYEWTFEKYISSKELAFRALYCYLLENEERNKFNFDLIIKNLDITAEEAEDFRAREAIFQKEVTGKRLSMGEIRELIGKAVINPQDFVAYGNNNVGKNNVQVYTDEGAGFNEDSSYFLEEKYDAGGYLEVSIPLDGKTKKLRIDPYMDYCITEIHEISFNGELLDLNDNKRIYINGKKLRSEDGVSAVFYYSDPNIVVELGDKVRSTGNLLRVRMTTTTVPENIIRSIKKELMKKIRF